MIAGLRTCVAAGLLLALSAHGLAAEKFRRLTGAQIQGRFAGMELSDDVHWRDFYEPGGTLKSRSMGRHRTGTWSVRNDQLCLDLGADSGGCYEVWFAGSKVEFRRDGLEGAFLEGKLGKPGADSQTTKGKRQ